MKIGLALSGGGVLGAAHMGALRQLEKKDVKIDVVCGTSAGAIVGVLFAAGGIEYVDRFFDEISQRDIFGIKNILRSRSTLKIFGQIEEILSEVVQVRDFSQLKMKFSCVATDYKTGKLVLLDKGNPVKAVLASSAYPGVFPMQKINEVSYIDGGVTLNMPVTPLKKQRADFIIASSIYSLPKVDLSKKDTQVHMAVRALMIMENRICEKELEKADFIFKPPVGQYYWYNFSKLNKIRQIGESYALKRIDKFPDLI